MGMTPDRRFSSTYTDADAITAAKTVKLDEFGAAGTGTVNDVTTSAHGLCPKLPNDNTKFLNGIGGFTAPAGAAHTQNTDTEITTNGTTVLISAGTLKVNLAADAGVTFDGIDVGLHGTAGTGVHGAGTFTLVNTGIIHGAPVSGSTTAPISSDWAYRYAGSADAAARTAAVSDAVYGTAWNAVTTIAPSKNAVYDKIESLGSAQISDLVYSSAWADGTTTAPSKHAIYDKIEALLLGAISTEGLLHMFVASGSAPAVQQAMAGASYTCDGVIH